MGYCKEDKNWPYFSIMQNIIRKNGLAVDLV